jgi:hypothetical protein
MSKESITLSVSTSKRLSDFCRKKKIMSGERYYRVPDYNSAISLLLKEHPKKKKKTRNKR